MRVVIAAFAILLSFCVLSAPVLAETNDSKPSKESLLAAWEQMQKDDSYTVAFEKTKEQGIYNFETTIFPFKGKLKVLNELIEKNPAYYYGDFRDYDKKLPDGDYIGIVEVELLGVAKEFAGKFRYSYETWERGNALYYHADAKKWYTHREWVAYKESMKANVADTPAHKVSKDQEENKPTFFGVFLSWLPMILLIGFYAYYLRKSLYSKVMKLQIPYMETSQAHMAKTEKLLKEILQTLKNKQQ